jgi:hypothetical protein
MAFQFKVDADELKGPQPVPAGVYTVRLKGFKPKLSKKGDTTNLNPQVEICDNPLFEGKPLFTSLNSAIPSFINDFCHSFGLPMDNQLGEGGLDPQLPGDWDGDESDPSSWKYTGPLLGRTAQWEVVEGTYQGKPKNEIRCFICAVPNCASEYPDIRHSTNMVRE